MDLSEVKSTNSARHPWEVARVRAIVSILARRQREFRSVLDYGCGDGFTGQAIQEHFGVGELVGVDVHLPASSLGKFSVAEGTRELWRDESELDTRRFDLALLCDVIEHVDDDRGLLLGIIERRLSPGALLLVTVPAFQALFSAHDRALRHFRRYSLSRLRRTLDDAGLERLDDGYLFGSLIGPRLVNKVVESVRPADEASLGIGGWTGGPLVTALLTRALSVDNAILIGARRVGLLLPGLPAWALCKTP
jgi:SAM-dependent methyltransferase